VKIFFLNLILIFTLLSSQDILAQVESLTPLQKNVDMEWEAIPGAKSYDIELKKDATEPILIKAEKSAWSGPVAPGIYKMRMRARDDRGVPGPWSDPDEFKVALAKAKLISPKPQDKVDGVNDPESPVELVWTPILGAQSYEVEIKAEKGEFKIAKVVSESRLSINLAVCAGYSWKVTAKGQGLDSVSETEEHFVLLGAKIQNPRIQKPASTFVRSIKWSVPKHTSSFAYLLSRFNSESKSWEKVANQLDARENNLVIDPKWQGGKYKLALKAKGNLRQSSDKVELDFTVRSGDRSQTAEDQANMRQSIDRLTGWYGIASYLITMMNFQGKNYDQNSAATFTGIGGTGRLGAGYLSASSRLGFVGILDLSGITLDGYGNYTFASSEMSGIYRMHVGERAEIRHFFGGFYKELPELISDNSVSNFGKLKEVNLIKYLGPHYGIEYWWAMNRKLGLQANAHFYYSAMSLKTPNGQAISPSLSYQFGMLGSYRIRPNMTGLMGYAFRKDDARYKSSSTASIQGGVNSAIIQGHYLNLFLEWEL
jgi:hypothetical protein